MLLALPCLMDDCREIGDIHVRLSASFRFSFFNLASCLTFLMRNWDGILGKVGEPTSQDSLRTGLIDYSN